MAKPSGTNSPRLSLVCKVDISKAVRALRVIRASLSMMFDVRTFFKDIKVVIARGIHLFPFRTEKLSLVTPMVLRNSGRVGSRRFRRRGSQSKRLTPFFCAVQ